MTMTPPRLTPSPELLGPTPPPPAARSSRPSYHGRLTHEVVLAKGTLAGLCMTLFAGGIICSVMVYRYAPRLRPDCGSSLAAAPSEGVAKPLAAPAPASEMPSQASLAIESAAEPAPPTPAPRAATPPRALPAAPAATAPSAPAAIVLPVARPTPASAKGRGAVRHRGGPAAGNDSASPTEVWVDPFAQ
jgi:hypothetical protein